MKQAASICCSTLFCKQAITIDPAFMTSEEYIPGPCFSKHLEFVIMVASVISKSHNNFLFFNQFPYLFKYKNIQ